MANIDLKTDESDDMEYLVVVLCVFLFFWNSCIK